MKITNVPALTVLCLVPLATMVSAWKSEGHLIVSRIAYEILQQSNPSALKAATSLLQKYNIYDEENQYPFVESSTFADYIRMRGGDWQANWHFVDTPYLDQGDSIDNYPDFKFDAENVTTAILGIHDWLTESNDYKKNFVYQTMMPKMKGDEEYGKSYALRLFIHYFGDIHQPLHCLSRVDSNYPAGDRGGNMFNLPNHYEAKNLHSVWDATVYEFHTNDKLPYTDDSWASLGDKVQGLMSQYSINKSEYNNLNVFDWAQDTFQKGSQNAYNGVTENQKVSDDYVSTNKPIAERQLVLAGYRLAYNIGQIFKTSRSFLE